MGRDYLTLCNEVINLMSYLPAKTMEDLDTPEGRLIKQKMNEVLRELCCGEHDTWKFRERVAHLYASEGVQDYKRPDGHILFIRPSDDTNRPRLIYTMDEGRYLPLTSNGTPVYYWIYEDKIRLYPIPNKKKKKKEYAVKYLTNKYTYDNKSCLKKIMQ